MTTPETNDDELMAALADALREVAGPPSASDIAAAEAARQRIIDSDPWDIADLASDTLSGQPDEVRGADVLSARRLVFYADEVTISVDVTVGLIVCHVDAPEQSALTLLTPAGTRFLLIDRDGGEYELADPPAGPVRLECRSPASQVVTEWFRL
jgi:hypothetical protein